MDKRRGTWELLAPAGSPEIFRAVIEAGADAVYVGGSRFGARAYADNFTQEELLGAIDYAHLRGRKVYLTVNTLMKNREILTELEEYLLPFYEQGLDAVLVQDLGVLAYLRSVFPDLPVHTSTQMTVTDEEGVRFLRNYGVSRVVMAREVSIAEMRRIHKQTGMELEAFVHGALCYSYSGQCLLSSILGGRSGNRGRCAQPCRLPYTVLDDTYKEILSESYILSLRDLRGIEDLPGLYEAGIYSLKIEGRMKQAAYAAGVVSFYRRYMDQILKRGAESFQVSGKDLQKISDLGNRCGFTNRYYYAHNGREMVTFKKPGFETQNERLKNEILSQYADTSSRIPVKGEAFFYKGRPAKFVLSSGAERVEVEGMTVENAQKAPIKADELSVRLSRTGDTEFAFTSLYVDADEGIFVPNGAVNRLRREGITSLREELLAPFRRQRKIRTEEYTLPGIAQSRSQTPEGTRGPQSLNGMQVALAVSTKDQLREVLSFLEEEHACRMAEDREMQFVIYIESFLLSGDFVKELASCLEMTAAAGVAAYLMLPAVFREVTRQYYSSITQELKSLPLGGFVVRNYEELFWVGEQLIPKEGAKSHKSGTELITDHHLYTYNDLAAREFYRAGADYDTVPLELNQNEIRHRDNSNSEMVLYGRYPLMVSAQCVHGNTQGCDHRNTVLYLKDRRGKLFPVRNVCGACYNIIYNSLPTCLFRQREELQHAGIRRFRLQFTVEDAKETRHILEVFMGRQTLDIESTNGHYKRGVE